MDSGLTEVEIVPLAVVLETSTPFTYSFRNDPLYVAARCVQVLGASAEVPNARLFVPAVVAAPAGSEDGLDIAIR